MLRFLCVPFLMHFSMNGIKLRARYGQVSMKDGKILNFHKVFLAWSNIWCYNLKHQYIKVSVEAKAGWETTSGLFYYPLVVDLSEGEMTEALT